MNYKKLVVISKEHVTKNGSKFRSFFTPVKTKDGEKLITIKFGEDIKTSKIPARSLIIVSEENISNPKSLNPYIDKKTGKTKYPYFFIEEIEKLNELKSVSKEPETFEFSLDDLDDEEETESDEVVVDTSDDEVPF